MKIHEYQGKELLKKYGVAVPRGIVARSPEEAYHAAKELGTEVVVVKAQIHAGGRGKGGGVKLAKSADEARDIARQMLGMKLVTHQTGPEGREVRTLLIEEGLPIDKEFYLGVVLDRVTGRNVFMASEAGGMDIEEVAAHTPEKILKETIDPAVGFRPFQARKLAFGLGLPAQLVNQAAKFMPDSLIRRRPSSTFVPSRRTTIGTWTPMAFAASMTPRATMSVRTMPPKMFINTARTFGSASRILNAASTRSCEAPPPTSRKFAGSPPASLMMSIVAIARPAPFTMHAMLPSSLM